MRSKRSVAGSVAAGRSRTKGSRPAVSQRQFDEPRISLGASLMTLTNLMRRTTASRFQRMFGLSLVDGWVVTRLGPDARMSLDELAHRSGLAKSQMSRSVTNMVDRKLVSRTKNPRNNSEVILTLTDQGKAMYQKIMAAVPDFHRLLTKGLQAREIVILTEILERLIGNSRRNLREEQGHSRARST